VSSYLAFLSVCRRSARSDVNVLPRAQIDSRLGQVLDQGDDSPETVKEKRIGRPSLRGRGVSFTIHPSMH
jgi:hypothetical protein